MKEKEKERGEEGLKMQQLCNRTRLVDKAWLAQATIYPLFAAWRKGGEMYDRSVQYLQRYIPRDELARVQFHKQVLCLSLSASPFLMHRT